MFLKSQPLFIRTETPLHMGSGTDLGIVDMPIQREKHTGFPKIEASGLKGSIREVFTERVKDKEKINILFGPEDTGNYASSLGFSDGRVLLFPVKSMKGVFAWITCEEVLYRFINDIKMCCQENNDLLDQFVIPKANTIISSKSNLFINNKNVILEEFTYSVRPMDNNELKTMNWIIEILYKFNNKDNYHKEKMLKDIVVLSGDDFKDFVNYSTEVITRTRINSNTGTVESGALFTEEYLPVNTIIYSIVFASPIFQSEETKKSFKGNTVMDEVNNIISYFTENLPSIIQLGGNATLGKGIVKITTGGICNG